MASPNIRQHDWEEIWGIIWYNIFNATGAVGFIIFVGFFGMWIVKSVLQPEPAHSSYLSTPGVSQMATTGGQDRELMQKAFYQGVQNVGKPCAVKRKTFSEVRNCSVFGLRLGMKLDEAKQIIDQSGYFPEKASLTKIKGCHSDNEACVGYVFATKDGLSISVEFDPSFQGDETQLSVAQITLWFDPGANPYFDPNSFRANFVKIFGRPDRIEGSNAFWGDPEGRSIRVYAYEADGKSVIILEGTHPTNKVQGPIKIAGT
jgi:hypothetical protein